MHDLADQGFNVRDFFTRETASSGATRPCASTPVRRMDCHPGAVRRSDPLLAQEARRGISRWLHRSGRRGRRQALPPGSALTGCRKADEHAEEPRVLAFGSTSDGRKPLDVGCASAWALVTDRPGSDAARFARDSTSVPGATCRTRCDRIGSGAVVQHDRLQSRGRIQTPGRPDSSRPPHTESGGLGRGPIVQEIHNRGRSGRRAGPLRQDRLP